MNDALLVEILTEELPPKALARLMEAFSHGLFEGLKDKNFLPPEAEFTPFATPRRLAVLISSVLARQADRVVERKGPAFASALDAGGRPTPALLGFAKSCGVDVTKLERQAGEKGDYFVYRAKQKGEPLKNHLAAIVEAALKKLPVPKTMRWGAGEAQFVRPVHGVILLHGKKVVPGTVLGLKSGNKTRGHRFLSTGALTIRNAKDYEKVLKQQGKVIASFETRRETVARKLEEVANRLKAKVFLPTKWAGSTVIADGEDMDEATRMLDAQPILRGNEDLVDEVTALVEWPAVYVGEFEREFLTVPMQCISLTMQKNQKYFALMSTNAKLLPQFLFVSNMQVANPKDIVHGNERVLRARLSDARFFFDQDRKTSLETRVPRLANVVYHNKLGSQLGRVDRLQKLAGEIARLLRVDDAAAERAAMLAKADLLTDMVGEFPELQGIMGRYYAGHDGENPAVATAIEQHYFPKIAGGVLPVTTLATCVALADKLDTLTGIFGIGLAPSGDKDPFGLRRAALGVVRILVEKALPLDAVELLHLARGHFPNGVVAESVAQDLHGFMLDRLKPYLREKGFGPDEIDAILWWKPTRFDDLVPRLKALQAFRVLPEAEALAAANKRIRNILLQADKDNVPEKGERVDEALLREPAEQRLASELNVLRNRVDPLISRGEYEQALKTLAALRGAVDEFFDQVMVMVEDTALRRNRLVLLFSLHVLFLSIADISRLQTRPT